MTTENEHSQPSTPDTSSLPTHTSPPSDSPPVTRNTTIDTTVHVTTAETGAKVVGMEVHNLSITEEQAYNVSGLENPYLGLRSFGYEDRAKYAGREHIIAEAVEKLTADGAERTLLFITGASGSGKSSFALAGVLPTLEAYYEQLRLPICRMNFQPGHNPMAALRKRSMALDLQIATADDGMRFTRATVPPKQVSILVIDQFEELFTQAEETEREALFALLERMPPFNELWTHIIATMRSDFLPELFARKALYDIAKQGIDLRAMSVDELKEAIQKPLQVQQDPGHNQFVDFAGKRFESALLDRLAHDAAEDAALLPLLQVTLEDLWRRGSLKLSAYQGLTATLQQRAEMIYANRTDPQTQSQQPRSDADKATLMQIFLDLVNVSIDAGARRDVRCRRASTALEQGSPDRARLINELVNARLLSRTIERHDDADTGTDVVDIIHEALIRSWERLKVAIEREQHNLRQRARFEQAIEEWLQAEPDKKEHYLLDGVRLAEAQDLERRGDIVLQNEQAKELLRLSVERREAEQQRRVLVAVTQSLAAQALRQQNSFHQDERAALLARQAYLFHQRTQSRVLDQIDEALRTVLSKRHFSRTLPSPIPLERQPKILTFSLDGKSLACRDASNSILLWNINNLTAEPAVLQHHPQIRRLGGRLVSTSIEVAAYNPDGQTLASGHNDDTVRIWNLRQIDAKPLVLLHQSAIRSVVFSPDGQFLAVGSLDNTMWLWNLHRSDATPVILHGHEGEICSVAFSPDGQTLASGSNDKTVRLWDLHELDATPIILHGHEGEICSVAFSSDGQTLASGSNDKTVRLWNLRQSDMTPIILHGHEGEICSVAFSPDGQTLASGSSDETVRLWDLSQSDRIPILLHCNMSITKVIFSANGKSLLAGGMGIFLCDLGHPPAAPVILCDHEDVVRAVAFNPDGQTLTSASRDKTVRVWKMHQFGADPIMRFDHGKRVLAVAFSPDGHTLVSGCEDHTIHLWNLHQPDVSPVILHEESAVMSVAFSPDGQTLASGIWADKQSSVRLWNLRRPDRDPITLRSHNGPTTSVAFSLDGQTLATSGSQDYNIRLWNLQQSGTEPRILHQADEVSSAVFSPDGHTLACSSEKTVALWNLDQLEVTPILLRGHEANVRSVAFSWNGQILAAGSSDGAVRLWNLPQSGNMPITLQSGANEMPGDKNAIWSVAFSPDGRILAASVGKTVVLWIVPTDILADMVCDKVWRNLTLDEWQRYVGADIPYERTCPNLPIHPSLIEAIRDFVRSGNINSAITLLQHVRELEPGVDLSREVNSLIDAGAYLVTLGRVNEALDALAAVQTFDPNLVIPAESWNGLCWHGCLHGRAADVLFAGDRAVALAPEDGNIRDRRGLARALTGDYAGAIEDFTFFITWARANDEHMDIVLQREAWIAELQAGRNPIDAATLEAIRNQ